MTQVAGALKTMAKDFNVAALVRMTRSPTFVSLSSNKASLSYEENQINTRLVNVRELKIHWLVQVCPEVPPVITIEAGTSPAVITS